MPTNTATANKPYLLRRTYVDIAMQVDAEVSPPLTQRIMLARPNDIALVALVSGKKGFAALMVLRYYADARSLERPFQRFLRYLGGPGEAAVQDGRRDKLREIAHQLDEELAGLPELAEWRVAP